MGCNMMLTRIEQEAQLEGNAIGGLLRCPVYME
jgi:hypothetical protein